MVNIIQTWVGDPNKLYQEDMTNFQSKVPSGANYKLITNLSAYPVGYGPALQSDLLRLDYCGNCSANEIRIYADSDVVVDKGFWLPEVLDGTVYVDTEPSGNCGEVIITTGPNTILKTIAATYTSASKPGWMQTEIRNAIKTNLIKVIPKGYFVHHNLSFTKNLKNNKWTHISTLNAKVGKLPNGDLQFIRKTPIEQKK